MEINFEGSSDPSRWDDLEAVVDDANTIIYRLEFSRTGNPGSWKPFAKNDKPLVFDSFPPARAKRDALITEFPTYSYRVVERQVIETPVY